MRISPAALTFSLTVLLLGLVPRADAQLVISEFLASNSNSITDENGDNEDWIEIANTAGTGINTLGWYLTDDVNQLRKWAFPSRTMNAGSYLVVFASSKNRKPASGNLHTNFKLESGGEYLALTKDVPGGGVEVVQAFNPYPQQGTNVSYGAGTVTNTTSLIRPAALVKAFIPTSNALGTTWQGAAANEPFDDSGWLSGTTGVGFGDSSVPIAVADLKQRLNSNTSGDLVVDSSGAAHPGTNNGSTWEASSTDAAPTPRSRAGVMQFVATENDQVSTPGQADFDQTQCTVTFWMRSAGITGAGAEAAMIWDRRTGNGVGLGTIIAQHTNGKLFFQAGNGGIQCSFSSIASISDDRWHHVAVVMSTASGGTNTIYVDGVSSGSGTNSGAWGWTTTTPIELGSSHDPYWFKYSGFLDDVRFYSRQLTSTEISQIYVGGDDPTSSSDIGLNVQAQMQGVSSSAFIRVPFNVADPASIASLRLTQRWNDGFVAYVNGTQIAAQNAPGSPAYNSVATAVHGGSTTDVYTYNVPSGLLRAGTNILAIHGLNTSAADPSFLILPQLEATNVPMTVSGYLTPTPNAANSAFRTNVGPFVSAVTKNPNPRPTGTSTSPDLTITAKVTPSLRPLSATNPVQLKYLIMFGSEQTVNMTPTATPGVYSATIPTNTLGSGQMLRWRVVASDTTGITGTAPEYPDPLDTEKYYGTVAVDSSIASNLPVLYWFTPSSTAADNTTGTRNAFFYKAAGDTGVGRFYDNVEINLHGQSSSGFPKKSYDLDFNEDNRFEWDVTQERVKDINLLTNWGDKAKTRNMLAHEALSIVGSVHHWCHQVRVQQVTPANATNPANQFWSIADMMEDGDDDFIARNGGDPEGALYKIYDNLASSGSAEKKSRLYEGKTDITTLISGIDVAKTLAVRRQFAYDNLDLPQCISYFVGLAIISSQDHGHKNFYMYRDSDGTREWSILPWDVDLTWGRNWIDASGYFTDTIYTNNDLDMYNASQQGKGENRLYSLIVGNSDLSRQPAPEFRDMVLRRLRTVLDGYFSKANVIEDRLTQVADLLDPPTIGTSDADRDRTKWGTWGNDGGNSAGGAAMRYHLNQIRNVYLPGRRTFLNTATLAGATVPASQPANAGDLITIETVDVNPSTGNQGHEFFVIRNSNNYSVDISGWQITGAVKWTFKPGTVLPPGGGATQNLGDLYVAKDPFLFRQRTSVPDDGLAGANQYRFVQGPYQGQLSARGETIELRDSAGTLVRTKSWAPAPTAAQNQLRISELNYAPTAPTAAESAALSGVTKGDFEYIELVNIGTTPLTLTGAHFDQGITFTFPAFTLGAGARCLVVANTLAFQLRYGHALDAQIVGQFEGNLANNGETIQLMDAVGESILEFTYNNSWYPPSDEGGRTLAVRDLNASWQNYDRPTHWAPSGDVNGSPGAADTDLGNHYSGWRWAYFTSSEMPSELSPNLPAALNQDPDQDGLNNLGEYAFARSPKAGDQSAILTPSIVSDGGTNYLAVTFKRQHKALDLTYIVEATNDFATWTPLSVQLGAATDLGNGVEQVTIRDEVPHNPASPRHVRVRVVK